MWLTPMNQEETMLLHKERYKETIKNLTVMSDILARNVFKDKNACEYVLRIILEDKELTVIDNETQMDFRNMHGRGVVLDCVAKDGSGRVFNVEIQQDDEGAHPKRARYHLGMMDSNVLDTGKNFDKLPETYVIFVTLKDALGCGLPIAHIDRIIRENGKEFGDEEHFIYVDSSKNDGGELGRLMHDFRVKEVKEMQAGALADRVHELKETEKGVEHMCKEMEALRLEGVEEGRMEEKKAVAYSLADRKMSAEEIAEIIKVNIETVKGWLAGSVSTAR